MPDPAGTWASSGGNSADFHQREDCFLRGRTALESAVNYSFVGSLLGSTVFTTNGSLAAGQLFGTILRGAGSIVIDRLVITTTIVTNNSSQSVNLDNINVTSVPEPTTLLLLGTGLCAAAVRRARRKNA